jgi:hypothetical protein
MIRIPIGMGSLTEMMGYGMHDDQNQQSTIDRSNNHQPHSSSVYENKQHLVLTRLLCVCDIGK